MALPGNMVVLKASHMASHNRPRFWVHNAAEAIPESSRRLTEDDVIVVLCPPDSMGKMGALVLVGQTVGWVYADRKFFEVV